MRLWNQEDRARLPGCGFYWLARYQKGSKAEMHPSSPDATHDSDYTGLNTIQYKFISGSSVASVPNTLQTIPNRQ